MANRTADIVWNGKRYELVLDGKAIIRSKYVKHLQTLVAEQREPRILKAKITNCVVKSTEPGAQSTFVVTEESAESESIPEFGVNERFELIDYYTSMVVHGGAKGMLITGTSGIGKSYGIMNAVHTSGLRDYRKAVSELLETQGPGIEEDDDAETIKDKAVAFARPTGRHFVVVKGHSTAKALYRLLCEHSDDLIIFDDCDGVLKDSVAVDLLKSAIDTTPERWVSWLSDAPFNDLPLTFRFTGKIIFISNLNPAKVDAAIRTRCFNVDVTLSHEECIERMRAVIDNVEPDTEMEIKELALGMMEKYKGKAKSINFRSLLRVIEICKAGATPTGIKPIAERAALLSLLED